MQQDPHHGAAGEPSNGASGQDGWMPPRDDINAPDLYIPSTYRRRGSVLFGKLSSLDSDGARDIYATLWPRIGAAEPLSPGSLGIQLE